MDRILALSRPALTPDVVPYVGVALRPAQVDGLTEWVRALLTPTPYGPPGLAVLAGVGHGKTLLGLLLPHVARYYGRPDRTLYLVPAAIRDQWFADADMWRIRGARVGDPTVLTHEGLSQPRGRDALRDLAPDILVIDEAHHFADPESGRWRRVVEYLRLRPDTRVVVLSGSLSWRSVLQARHLLLAALRGWCPLPSDRSIVHWAACLDVKGEPCADDARALAPLVQWAADRSNTLAIDGVLNARRWAYRRRLASCPGVVLTTTAGVEASLRLVAWRPPVELPPALAAAVKGLEEAWVLPDGTELVSSLEFARHAATLPLGLYQRWDPATVDPEWLATRAAWNRAVRNAVLYRGHVYQTPSEFVRAAERGDLDGTADGDLYRAWVAVEDDDPPRTEAIWLDGAREHLGEVLEAYCAGLPQNTRPLVWVRTPEVGRVVAEVLALHGCDSARYHGAGSSPPAGDGAVASYVVHGTGWSGAPAAGYTHALVLEPPSSGATWEQLLGRTHRAGQVDDVVTHVLCSTGRGYAAIKAGVEDARYVEETTGQAQRLLFADWVGFHAAREPHGGRG